MMNYTNEKRRYLNLVNDRPTQDGVYGDGRWITVHPNGASEGNGRHIHLDDKGKIDSNGPLSDAIKKENKSGMETSNRHGKSARIGRLDMSETDVYAPAWLTTAEKNYGRPGDGKIGMSDEQERKNEAVRWKKMFDRAINGNNSQYVWSKKISRPNSESENQESSKGKVSDAEMKKRVDWLNSQEPFYYQKDGKWVSGSKMIHLGYGRYATKNEDGTWTISGKGRRTTGYNRGVYEYDDGGTTQDQKRWSKRVTAEELARHGGFRFQKDV